MPLKEHDKLSLEEYKTVKIFLEEYTMDKCL